MLTSNSNQSGRFSSLFMQNKGSSLEDSGNKVGIPDTVHAQLPNNGFHSSLKQVSQSVDVYDVNGSRSSHSYSTCLLEPPSSNDYSLKVSHGMNDRRKAGIIRDQVKPKRLQASTSTQSLPMNGGYVRRLAAKNAMACVNAMFDPVRKKRKNQKKVIHPNHNEMQLNSPSLLSPNNTDILIMSKHEGMSGVLGKRKQPDNSSDDGHDAKKAKQELQEKEDRPSIHPIASLTEDSLFTIESLSLPSSSSPSSITESDLECTESITSTTSEESHCASDCSEYCDNVPFSKSGLLYNGSCIHSNSRFFLQSDCSIASRIIPLVVPQYFESFVKLKAEALKESSSRKRSQKGDNGWVPIGSSIKTVDIKMEGGKCRQRRYFIGIQRKKEKVFTRDSILLRSGRRKGDTPFVAKICSIWQETGGIMMSVFWYYRKEDTDKANSLQFVNMEIMASQHHDDISVACIDDKCIVLGLTEFCRFKAMVEMHSFCVPTKSFVIPNSVSKFNQTLSETHKLLLQSEVYLCYRAYNHVTGKILKASMYK